MIINAIITNIARTKKIPKPMPALKIPLITLHELTITDRRIKENIELNLDFFIGCYFDNG